MNLPAHLQKYETRDIGAALQQNLGSAAPPYVSIAGNRFTLIDAAGNEMPVPTFDPQIGVYLDAVIIDAGDHKSRIYYAKPYDASAQGFSPPDCWSDNGTGPSISCSSPQGATCTPDPTGATGCKWSVWGSHTSASGAAVPKCQEVQKLALLIPGVPQTVFLLRVPPNSHKHLRAYQETCKGSGVKIADILTRIFFDQSTQGTLLFKGVTYIDEATAELRQAAWNEKKTDTLVGRTDVARGALPVPATQQIAVQPVQQPQQQSFFPAAQPAPTAPVTASSSAIAGPVGPAEQPTQRRRRRTQAEMAAANGAAPGGPAPAANPVQAPFPHPGQAVQAQFGISQGAPVGADPKVAGMLDSFFGKAG